MTKAIYVQTHRICGLGVLMLLTIQWSSAAETLKSESDEQITSIYTSLSTKEGCTLVNANAENDEPGYARGSTVTCPGIAGYRVQIVDGDARQTIDIYTPVQKKYELNYWTVITRAFSEVGQKAEWRVAKRAGKLVPIGIIVRVNSQVDKFPRQSFLAVAKITPTDICVTDRIVASATANDDARSAADNSAQKPCLPAQP